MFYRPTYSVELTSADPISILQQFCVEGIQVKNLQKQSELTYTMFLSETDYHRVFPICTKTGSKIRILSKMGVFIHVQYFIRRLPLILGALLLAAAFLYLPSRILFVEVQGNVNVPTQEIIYAAEVCGIQFGSSREEVRSEKVKNALLSAIPKLKWVGVNTSGSVAIISVREREEEKESNKPGMVSSVVASNDGVITSITVTNGNPLCVAGEYVTKGQVLVSGYTDCGRYIQASASEAEVMANTNRTQHVIFPLKAAVRSNIIRTKRKFSILIGKKRINLRKDSGILDSSCGRIYKEKYAVLPGGFRLPFAICTDIYTWHDIYSTQESATDLQQRMADYAHNYLCQQMTAGNILSGREFYYADSNAVRLEGEYSCHEMIGRVREEKIGE